MDHGVYRIDIESTFISSGYVCVCQFGYRIREWAFSSLGKTKKGETDPEQSR